MVYKAMLNKDPVTPQKCRPISAEAEANGSEGDMRSIHNAKPTDPSRYLVAQLSVAGSTKKSIPHQASKKSKRTEKKRMFGLAQEQHAAYILPEDYEQRYPPDEFGQEMGPNARVWRVYLDEAELNDRDMVEGWKDGIDVLLVFAGLFSAVVTTFVTQTSQKLDQDFGQVTASLLTELIGLQRSLAVSSSLDGVPPAKINLSSPPQFSTSDVWVNGLWFTSLALSLITALFAVLIKQWVQHYVSFISGTPQERARIHHFRYMGIQRWSLSAIIGVLPVLLYTALFLFVFGLVVFLQPLKPEIACVIGVIGGIALTLYAATNALPTFYPQCPYRTPLTGHVRSIIYYAGFVIRTVTFPLTHRLLPCLFVGKLRSALCHIFPPLTDWFDDVRYANFPSYKAIDLKSFESNAAEDIQDEVILEAIHWLLISSANPSVKPIALQSLSGLPFRFSRFDLLVRDRAILNELTRELYNQQITYQLSGKNPESFIGSPLFYATERTLRAALLMPEGNILIRTNIPITRRHLQMHTEAHHQDIAIQQPLTTYIINYAKDIQDQTVARDVMPTLANLYTMTSETPPIFYAWYKRLEGKKDVFKCPDPSLAGVYGWIRPLFDGLLDWGSSSRTWEATFPFVARALPSDLVEGHRDLLERFDHKAWPIQAWTSIGAEFRVMLLKGVIAECKSSPSTVARLGTVVKHAVKGLSSLSCLSHSNGQQGRSLLIVLRELYSQPFFINDYWTADTYLCLFAVYILIPTLTEQLEPPESLPNLAPTPLQYVPDILLNGECTSGLVQAICLGGRYYEGRISEFITNQMIPQLLHELNAPNPLQLGDLMIANIFTAFQNLDGMPNSRTPIEGSLELQAQWSPDVQPLVRWILAQIIAYNGAEHPHPSIQTLAAQRVERADVLTFVCSSFLIDATTYLKPVFGQESYILLQLAVHHRDQPGAIDTWRAFLSWVVTKSANLDLVHSKYMREEKGYKQYVHMVDLLDQLVNTLGLDGSEWTMPRPEDYDGRLSANKGYGIRKAELETAGGGSAHTAISKGSVFRRLLPWKARPNADANREEIGLESRLRATPGEL